MTDSMTIGAAKNIEAYNWARKGYRVTRFDGAVPMTAAEREEFSRTGRVPEVK